jgi:hypothetical protein
VTSEIDLLSCVCNLLKANDLALNCCLVIHFYQQILVVQLFFSAAICPKFEENQTSPSQNFRFWSFISKGCLQKKLLKLCIKPFPRHIVYLWDFKKLHNFKNHEEYQIVFPHHLQPIWNYSANVVLALLKYRVLLYISLDLIPFRLQSQLRNCHMFKLGKYVF